MDSPTSNANPPPVSDVSNKSDEEKISQSSEDTVPIDEPPQPVEDLQIAIRDQDREYGCKYCDKKFSNKQALGGHQNAHKVERALEKNVLDAQENSLGYFGSPSTHFLTSYHRSNDFLHRPSYFTWPYPSQHHGGIHIGEPYVPPRPFSGFNNVYPGLPRIPHQFQAHPSYIPNQALNLGLSNIGASNSNFRPVSDQQGLSLAAFAGTSRNGPARNPGDGNNGPGDEQVDDSGLDLTLKL